MDLLCCLVFAVYVVGVALQGLCRADCGSGNANESVSIDVDGDNAGAEYANHSLSPCIGKGRSRYVSLLKILCRT